MSQVGRQEWQFCSHIRAASVPPNQRIDCIAVTEIVNSWPAAAERTNVADIQESPQTALESKRCIGPFSVPSIPDERRGGENRKVMLAPYLQVTIDFTNHILRQRKDT